MLLSAPSPSIAEDATIAAFRGLATEGIGTVGMPTWQRLQRAAGSLEAAAGDARHITELDDEYLLAVRREHAGVAIDAAQAWLASVGTLGSEPVSRGARAVAEAARVRIAAAAGEFATGRRLPALRAADQLGTARALVNGIGAASSGAVSAQVVTKAGSDIARSAASRVSTLASGAAALLGARASNSLGDAMRATAELAPEIRAARAVHALDALTDARDVVRALPSTPNRDELDGALTHVIDGVVGSMAHGLHSLRFPDEALDALRAAQAAPFLVG